MTDEDVEKFVTSFRSIFEADFVRRTLSELIDETPIVTEASEMDLNPHLVIKDLVTRVCDKAKENEMDVSREEVMLIWLTDLYFSNVRF